MFHIVIDLVGVAVLAYGAWLAAPAVGFAVSGLGILLLHGAIQAGRYDSGGDE